MVYDASTREQFDERTQIVLDQLLAWGRIEVLPPRETNEGKQWFVQCWRKVNPEYLTGAFGDTPYLAADRLLQATRAW